MITRKTKFSDLVAMGDKLVEHPELCMDLGTAKKLLINDPNLTVGDFIDGKIPGTLDEAHCIGVLLSEVKKSSLVRKGLIERIKDPMAALQVYVKLKDTTEEEDMMLKKKFEGLLPTAEKELKEGKIKRVK